MKLVVLGSGTCVPSLKRNAPGYYLESGDKQLLIDCGSGTLLQLERANKSYKGIDAVFLTHLHPDHVSDLMPLIHALLATPGLTREDELLIAGPRGVKKFYERCILSLLRKPQTFKIQVKEGKDTLSLGAIRIFSKRTVHAQNSIAYRFEEGGKSLVMTGDADYDEGLVELAHGTDLLVTDCSFPDEMKVPGHMTPKECAKLAKEAGVKKLLLSHIYPAPYPDIDRAKSCRDIFDGEVVLAEDLLEIEI